MSRLVKKLSNWMRGDDARNDSVTPLKNGGTSSHRRSQPNPSNVAQISTSSKRESKLTSMVTLEQMKKDGVFKFCNAGRLTAAEIWGDRMISNEKLNRTVTTHDSQMDTDANLAPCTTNVKGPRLSYIWRRNSDTEKKTELDDWDDIPCLSIDEIMADMVIPDHMISTGKAKESNWSIWRRNSPLTDCGIPKKRTLDDAFDDWDDAGYQSIEEIMKGIVIPDKELDHTVSTHDSQSQVDTDVPRTPSNTTETDKSLSITWSQHPDLAISGSPLKKRKMNEVFDDMDHLRRATCKQSQQSIVASTTEQLDTTTEQSDHTISTPTAQLDTSAVPLVTTAAEQSQTSPRVPKRKKRRTKRRFGKKRKQQPRKQ